MVQMKTLRRAIPPLLVLLFCLSLLPAAAWCADAEPVKQQGSGTYSATALTGRVSFLNSLRSQLGSGGEILGGAEGETYTKWYLGGEYREGWNEDTPWCGVFVSWAAAVPETAKYLDSFSVFASVDTGMAAFQDGTNGAWREPEERPLPGDLVFFDWDKEGEDDFGKPDHVGVVLRTDPLTGTLYTIEGNNENTVKECSYPKDDARILGFGVLNWK